MRCLLGVLIVVGAIGMAAQQATAPAQANGAAGHATIEKLKDNLFVIKGGGGNTAAFVTSKGVVIVDTKLASWGQAIMDQVRSVTDKPVTTIINTHTHGDHTGSNEFFPASVEVVAQENTKANMEKMDAFKGDKAQFLPDKTFKDKTDAALGRRPDRPLLLRRRPHQRRQRGRVPGAARRARRRSVRAQRHAAHRRQQRRQRRRVSRTP